MDKLSELMDEYDAEFHYTTDDDGIHVVVDGVEFWKDYDLRNWNSDKHKWVMYNSPGMYDTIYQCRACKTLHSVSIDNPDTALPERGCIS